LLIRKQKQQNTLQNEEEENNRTEEKINTTDTHTVCNYLSAQLKLEHENK